MNGLFLLLFFVSLVCLIVGLVKPTLLTRFIKGNLSRMKVGLIFGVATFVFFILFGMTVDKSQIDQARQNQSAKTNTNEATQEKQKSSDSVTESSGTVQNEAQQSPTPAPTPAPAGKSDQQVLEENLAGIVKSVGGSDMSYRGLQIDNSDPERPKDTKMITVSVNVKSFFNKSSLLRNTGKLSSSIFKSVYDAPNIKAYDIIVWYYGETTDKYGNKNDSIILTYVIDKTTYSKINWQNFNQSSLCDFLAQESKTSGTFDTACNVLANIK